MWLVRKQLAYLDRIARNEEARMQKQRERYLPREETMMVDRAPVRNIECRTAHASAERYGGSQFGVLGLQRMG